MFRLRYLILLSILLAFLGCKSKDKSVVTDTSVVLTGTVQNVRTERGIPNASVGVVEYPEVTTGTDSTGNYTLFIEVGDSLKQNIHVYASAGSGYGKDTTVLYIVSGRKYQVPTLSLKNLADDPDTSNSGPSTSPATIYFVGSNVPYITVRETGEVETARLTYEVRDTRGVPVDLNNSATVRFSILGGTTGGEYLGNDTAVTNENGRAMVSVISGTRPGTLQIMATVHDTIRARPVQLSVHTGPPDSVHTTVGFHRINYPGLDWVGRVDTVVALIGDRYSNPVPVGTQCYFYSDHGVVEPQGNANIDGMSRVLLLSGNPFPFNSTDRGWSRVHLQTVDCTGHRYSIFGTVLWTGVIWNFNVVPNTFDIPNRGMQQFNITLSDVYDHPLSSGTQYMVTSTFGTLNGDINLIFPDTWSDDWTHFTFTLSDPDTIDHAIGAMTVLTIAVAGDNGRAMRQVSGVIH